MIIIEKRKEKEIIDRVNFFLISACLFLSTHISTSIISLLGIQKHVNAETLISVSFGRHLILALLLVNSYVINIFLFSEDVLL